MSARSLAERALSVYGAREQLTQAAEECCELAVECHHYRRGKGSPADLATEIADVEIMLEQLILIVNAADPEALAKARARQRMKAEEHLRGEVEP